MLRICIDTNVWISGIAFTGLPSQIVDLALKKKFQPVISDFILEEIERNLVKKIELPVKKVRNLIYQIEQVADVYQVRGQVNVLPKENKDNFILETAWMGRAKYLVTGDHTDLLPLRHFHNVKIVSPATLGSILKLKN